MGPIEDLKCSFSHGHEPKKTENVAEGVFLDRVFTETPRVSKQPIRKTRGGKPSGLCLGKRSISGKGISQGRF